MEGRFFINFTLNDFKFFYEIFSNILGQNEIIFNPNVTFCLLIRYIVYRGLLLILGNLESLGFLIEFIFAYNYDYLQSLHLFFYFLFLSKVLVLKLLRL